MLNAAQIYPMLKKKNSAITQTLALTCHEITKRPMPPLQNNE